MSHDDLEHAGFKDRTRVDEALETILHAVSGHDRTERIALGRVDGRTLAETVTAPTPVPGYDRAAMDGYAVRAEDTFGATGRSPTVLREADGEVAPGEAVRVHTGSDLPDGADAVVMVEETEIVGDEIEVFDAVAEGENVGEVGEDVAEGEELYQPGHRIRPSDLGLLKSVGIDQVEVYDPPTVGVIPTGEELVQRDPAPGEVIETNGLTVSRLANRWGAIPTYRNVVDDDPHAIRAAIQRDLAKDVVVTTGGSSVGERDYTPEVVDDIGEVLVHGVALKPGHPVALGVVEDTPVIMLPGYPVACIINAVQFLRPILKTVGNMPVPDHPTVEARLTRKISSEPGTRTFARVRLTEDGEDDTPAAEPTRASGAGVLSSVALADGWVVVPEEREGYDAGDHVAVENWEWSA
ncbi:molybdopterin molybdotransferase MoeA [Haloplanus halobius]|uniref:molybdopterin molybdotransferase MoeA n=1 Tax=Haloplanus halobius TaxID=2934938 RepID=UPI00200BA8F0|nr:gephyrin-like molybdotransferase Glp [Haloplanus sp. XH21]